MASVAEQILARIQAALQEADFIPAERIERSREDAWAEDELPAINITRASSDTQSHANGLERHLLTFDLECLEAGKSWETDADAIHMQAHVVLIADAQLQALGRGLRCTGTEAMGASADIPTARLTAHYQIQFITRQGDPTRAIT